MLFNGFVKLWFALLKSLVSGGFYSIFEAEIAEFLRVEFRSKSWTGGFGKARDPIVRVKELLDRGFHLTVDHLKNGQLRWLVLQKTLTEPVDPLSLLIHDFVIFKQIFPDVKVPLFHLLLIGFNPAADHRAFNRVVLLHADQSAGEHVFQPFATELTHQVVFQGKEEPARTRIALTA